MPDRAHLLEQIVTAAVVLASILGPARRHLADRARAAAAAASSRAAVRRFGEGDLKARADVSGSDEIAAVAAEFNSMAERLERYRASSLGELLAGAAGGPGGDRRPAGSGAAARRARASCRARTRPRRRCWRINTERARADPFAGVDPGVRALVDRLRAHVLAGKGAYVPKGFEEAVRVPSRPKASACCCRAPRRSTARTATVAGAAIVLQDVTRLFRFDELKNDLVATVAHEFRTPLTSLRMALHLCTEEAVGPLTPKQADLLFAAREDCERLQVIVDELLNLSRIESGTIELHRRRTDPERAGRHRRSNRIAPRRAGAGRRSAPRCCPACRRCSSIPIACSWCSRTC